MIACKKHGKGIAMSLEPGLCKCRSLDDCCLDRENAMTDKTPTPEERSRRIMGQFIGPVEAESLGIRHDAMEDRIAAETRAALNDEREAIKIAICEIVTSGWFDRTTLNKVLDAIDKRKEDASNGQT
jgi:hypothetical protein